eukprot:15471499-Alexandrium_andersonii.AAC.1
MRISQRPLWRAPPIALPCSPHLHFRSGVAGGDRDYNGQEFGKPNNREHCLVAAACFGAAGDHCASPRW